MKSPDEGSSSTDSTVLLHARGAMQSVMDTLGGKSGWIAAALICAAYLACIVPLTSFPMQDYVNHVARAEIMADILFHHGAHFGRLFDVHPAPVPYVLPDLALMGAVAAFGVSVGAGVFTALVLLSLPCALLLYAHAIDLPWRARPFVFLIGLYLSTDWYFLMGFLAFRLALALIVTSLAIVEMLRRRWSVPAFITHIMVLVLGFLTHLSALVFAGAAIGVSALVRLAFRTTTLRREIWLAAPVVALFGWYFSVTARLHTGHGPLDYDLAAPSLRKLITTKIRNLPAEFIAFDGGVVLVTLLLFAACLFLPVRRELRSVGLRKPVVIEQVVLGAAFLGLYFMMPGRYLDASYVDVRALPMVALLVLFACLRLPGAAQAGRVYGNVWAVGLAALLATANLLYVMRPLETNNAWISRYRAVVASIPRGSYVLPVHTRTGVSHILHVASHVVLDRGALIPYLFSGDAGNPMTYFRYRHRPYAPHHKWYIAQLRGMETKERTVNWNRVGCEYDFLLVTEPFDIQLIHVPTVKVASNEAAALLAIDKRACEPGHP